MKLFVMIVLLLLKLFVVSVLTSVFLAKIGIGSVSSIADYIVYFAVFVFIDFAMGALYSAEFSNE